ncbi:PiggyBac transposase uribo2 [Plakobranchus ocellatus]|uniref:PiggyBac transposase uribo2 n=1 Tax=Plakobranchus ocellatus TaxID=259542 RepID=A0AAV4BK70_9GAST|nr:PiggyBac transposase uribo2 [Plakobranchus ocellatus]
MEEDSPDIDDLTSDESDFALDESEDDVSSSEEVEGESQSEVELDPDLDLRHANPWVRTYSPEDRPNPDHEFDEDCGPRDAPPPDAKPLDYILLFFTLDFLASVVTHTNNNATAFIERNRANIRPKSMVHKWAETSVAEIKAFFAIIVNMGLNRKPTIFSYWSTKGSQATPWFGNVMPRERFQLLKFFHLTRANLPRPREQGYDACARFQPIIDQFNNMSRRHYIPRQELSVDESLIGTKNRTQLIQYLPNKHHHKWGIKLWMLCESFTAYVLACYVYRGKRDRPAIQDNKGLAHRVVVSLLEMGNYLRKGYKSCFL